MKEKQKYILPENFIKYLENSDLNNEEKEIFGKRQTTDT